MSNLRHTDDSIGPASAGAAAAFGRYRLLAQLGQGGMADVFLALARGALGVNKLVVIKRLRAGFDRDRDLAAMFLDEARLAVRLNHPNVVHTYEAGESGGQCFLVMEYLEGLAIDEFLLRARTAGESVPLGAWLRVVVDALAGLHHAHELCDYDGTPLNIVHRDVSPQNIFVTFEGITKVVDFGIAKARLSSTVTDAGELKGKACYMAPEHVQGRASDRRADVFAMGVLLWELLAGGRRLFQGDAGQALQNVLHAPIPLPSSVVPGTPPALDAIVMRALERDPAARYRSADEMRRELEAFLITSDLFVGSEGVARALLRVTGDQRDKVRRRVQAFMVEAGPAPGGQERSFIGGTQVLARLASAELGASLPVLMTPSGTVMVAGNAAPSRAVVEAGRDTSFRRKARLAGYGLVGLSLVVFGAGAGLMVVRSQQPAPAARVASAAVGGQASVGASRSPGAAPAREAPASGAAPAREAPASGGAPVREAPSPGTAPAREAPSPAEAAAGVRPAGAVAAGEREASPAPPAGEAAAARGAAPVKPKRRGPPAAGRPEGPPSSAPAAPSLAAPKPEAVRPKVKLVDEEKRSLRLDE
jgi:tRNA A-37 threonylcarbamoyl transferase component Bud32